MMIPSLAPFREIPTGLAGYRDFGFRGLGRLGSVNVAPLAQAQFSGRLSPSYVSSQWQPGYSLTPQVWPEMTASQGFAQQVAGLLGGSAIQLPGNQVLNLPDGSNYPMMWVVQLPGGQIVNPASMLPQGVILSFPDECAAESAFASMIPGAQLSATCAAGGTGMTPTQLAVSQGATTPVTGSGQSTVVGYTPPVSSTPVSVAAPVQTSVTFAASDTCSSIAAKIGALQQAGQSNIVIWNQLPESLLTCPVAEALNPQDAMYAPSSAGTTGAGSMSTAGSGAASGTNAGNSGSTGATDNTALYVGLGIAALVVVLWLK